MMNMKMKLATVALAFAFAGSAMAGMADLDTHKENLERAGYSDVTFQGGRVGCSKSDLDTQAFTGKKGGETVQDLVCTQYGSAIIKPFSVN